MIEIKQKKNKNYFVQKEKVLKSIKILFVHNLQQKASNKAEDLHKKKKKK